jgi:hypothetical protein
MDKPTTAGPSHKNTSHKYWVADDVSTRQPTWLDCESRQPFKPVIDHPVWTATNVARYVIESPTY